jgi:hypothetical protein
MCPKPSATIQKRDYATTAEQIASQLVSHSGGQERATTTTIAKIAISQTVNWRIRPMEINPETINIAYSELSDAVMDYQDAANSEELANADLKTLIAEATANGDIEGKNQAARDAAARTMFADQYHVLSNMSIKTRAVKLRLDLAKIEVERIKTMLRVMELSK